MAFVFASTSAIDRLFEQRSNRLRESAKAGSFENGTNAPIRRPYRGIQIKEDTYATMSIIDGSGRPIPIVSESATGRFGFGRGQVNTYADFILNQVSEERTEKSQILETFGDSFVFFFGERPRMLSISGLLMNTDDFGWRAQFMDNYENLLRGTKLVQKNARLYLAWDTIVVEGYPISMSASEDADNPYTVSFQMQIFMTNYQDFGRIGNVEFPPAPRDTKTFDALNRELAGRDRYISTTNEVRLKNFESRNKGGGIGGFFREGIRSVNNITGFVGDVVAGAATLLSGRVVRKPLGIAGFLEGLQGNAAAVGFTQATADLFEFGGLTDVKLTIPTRSRFAPVNDLLLRTRISANIDEYPLLESENIPARWSVVEQGAFNLRQAARQLKQEEQVTLLAAHAALAQENADTLDVAQDLIQLTKTGFALFNTGRAVLKDPVGATKSALGLGGI